MRGPRAVPAAVPAAVVVAVLAALPVAGPAPMTGDRVGDPVRQARLVAEEDRRLTGLRILTARKQGSSDDAAGAGTTRTGTTRTGTTRAGTTRRDTPRTGAAPYRLRTGPGYTLVLTPRTQPYTISDLRELAPETFVHESAGSYLLSEHVFVAEGATLSISATRLRLASGTDGFATLTSFGGRLELRGTTDEPLQLTSWDRRAGSPDTVTDDGRAYVRAVGGELTLDHVDARDLGFWSGRTGGVALTGTDRPEAAPGSSASGVTGTSGDPSAGPSEVASALAAPNVASGSITSSTITGNAYGLFVANARDVRISGVAVRRSLVDGVLLHRFVAGGLIERTVAAENAGDGVVLDRGTENVSISRSTAERNRGSGFRVSGQALSDGPSAAGSSVERFGGNSVTDSVARDNDRTGIEVIGGVDVAVRGDRVDGNDMGIVVWDAAERVTVTGNTVSGTVRHGIAVRDGVTATTVADNAVQGGMSGVYVRDAVADVRANVLRDADQHGVSLVGDVTGTTVSDNTISGSGSSALDTLRRTGDVVVAANRTTGRAGPAGVLARARKLLRPMTLLWGVVIGTVLLSAVRARCTRALPQVPYAHHPYALRPYSPHTYAPHTYAPDPYPHQATLDAQPRPIDLRDPRAGVAGSSTASSSASSDTAVAG